MTAADAPSAISVLRLKIETDSRWGSVAWMEAAPLMLGASERTRALGQTAGESDKAKPSAGEVGLTSGAADEPTGA